jgi:hypothetical protein
LSTGVEPLDHLGHMVALGIGAIAGGIAFAVVHRRY